MFIAKSAIKFNWMEFEQMCAKSVNLKNEKQCYLLLYHITKHFTEHLNNIQSIYFDFDYMLLLRLSI